MQIGKLHSAGSDLLIDLSGSTAVLKNFISAIKSLCPTAWVDL